VSIKIRKIILQQATTFLSGWPQTMLMSNYEYCRSHFSRQLNHFQGRSQDRRMEKVNFSIDVSQMKNNNNFKMKIVSSI